MQLQEIAQKLDRKFKKNTIKDDWSKWKNLYPKENTGNQVGLVLDFSDEIEKIYTTCFPSKFVLNTIFESKQKNALIISHHPLDWNPFAEYGFEQWKQKHVDLMKKRKISFYAAHLMWDNAKCDGNKLLSTASAFPKAIGMKVERTFEIEGVQCGVIGTHNINNFDELSRHIFSVIKHPLNIIKNNDKPVKKIGFCPGGGMHTEYMDEPIEEGIDTYIVGVSRINNSYQERTIPPMIELLEKQNINWIGCGHYHTEKWAPLLSVPYFKQFAPAEFVEDIPKNDLLD